MCYLGGFGPLFFAFGLARKRVAQYKDDVPMLVRSKFKGVFMATPPTDAKIKLELSRDDFAMVCNGLILARASALRLSNRAGQVNGAVIAYRGEYERCNALLARLSSLATV